MSPLIKFALLSVSEKAGLVVFARQLLDPGYTFAIVFAAGGHTLGVGAGPMSRVDPARIARWKANEHGIAMVFTGVRHFRH